MGERCIWMQKKFRGAAVKDTAMTENMDELVNYVKATTLHEYGT